MNDQIEKLLEQVKVNDKIRELAEQAGCTIDRLGYGEGNLEKFADLLIWEFLEVVERQFGGGNNGSVEWDRAIDFTYEDVKKHFGVEE